MWLDCADEEIRILLYLILFLVRVMERIKTYRIRSNYRTYPYKRTVKKFQSQCNFSLPLFKSICCGYSFKLHRLVDAIQMSAYNICLYKENQKQIII